MFDNFSRFRKGELVDQLRSLRNRSANVECDAGELFLRFPHTVVVNQAFLPQERVTELYNERNARNRDAHPTPEERYRLRQTFSLVRGKFSFGYGDVYANYKTDMGDVHDKRLAYCHPTELTDELLEREDTRFQRAHRIDYPSYAGNIRVTL